MIITKINEKGNFDCWNEVLLKEIRVKEFSSDLGIKLFESEDVVLWKIKLEPNERLPFRSHLGTYCCNCLTDGLLLSRNADGAVDLLRFEKGDYFFRRCEEEAIHDLENIGESMVKITIVEELEDFRTNHVISSNTRSRN
jgi:hypothetical protein